MQIEHLSFSSLNAFMKSPHDFVMYKQHKKEQTPQMLRGEFLHAMVLQPETIDDKYIIADVDLRTKDGKEKKLMAEESGKKIINSSIKKEVDYAIYCLNKNEIASNIIGQLHTTEKKIEWKNKYKFIGYLDGLADSFIGELKSTANAEPHSFQRDLINNNYHVQQAMYQDGSGVKKSIIIAVDFSGGVSVHMLSDELIEFGMNKYQKAVDDFKYCDENNLWHMSYDFYSPSGYYTVELPKYLK